MASPAESSPLSQSSVGSKARRVSRRGQIWSNFTEEVDATGYTTVICRECKQVFKHPSMASTLSYHWRKRHPNKEQPAAKLRRFDITLTPRTNHTGIFDKHVRSSVDALFTALNSNVELPGSFDTFKSMLVSRCAAVQKSVEAALGDLRVRPSITCDVWSYSSMKNAYKSMLA
uniref:BED-type domain-containing protein n=1 Tax=Ditylenchus dipsaci TaxID=166011 RepID=A0A915CP95_9BILA